MINFVDTKKQLSKEDLNSFESTFNIQLPEDYKSHVLIYNGGRPTKPYFNNVKISHFYPIKYGENGILEEAIKSLSDILPSNFFPFAYDGGGNQICIHLSNEDYGKVSIWYHDMDEGDDVEFLADSFKDFLNGLSKENEF